MPSKGDEVILMSGKFIVATIVILQQLFLIFIVQQPKAEVGSSYVSRIGISFQIWEGKGFLKDLKLISFPDFVYENKYPDANWMFTIAIKKWKEKMC